MSKRDSEGLTCWIDGPCRVDQRTLTLLRRHDREMLEQGLRVQSSSVHLLTGPALVLNSVRLSISRYARCGNQIILNVIERVNY